MCDVLTIPCAHFVLCNVFCTGYFPGNGHEYCWPCAKTATANTFLLIGGSMLVFSLWGILSFAIDSMSVAILLNYLQVINNIQVNLTVLVSLLVFAFRDVVRIRATRQEQMLLSPAQEREFCAHDIPILSKQGFNIDYPTTLKIYSVPIMLS